MCPRLVRRGHRRCRSRTPIRSTTTRWPRPQRAGPRLERRRWVRWAFARGGAVCVLRDRLKRACLSGTMICAVRGAIRCARGHPRVQRGRSVLCGGGGGRAMSYNGSSKNVPNPSYRQVSRLGGRSSIAPPRPTAPAATISDRPWSSRAGRRVSTSSTHTRRSIFDQGDGFARIATTVATLRDRPTTGCCLRRAGPTIRPPACRPSTGRGVRGCSLGDRRS